MSEPAPSLHVCVEVCRSRCCRNPALRLLMYDDDMRRLKGLGLGRKLRFLHRERRPRGNVWELVRDDDGCPLLEQETGLCAAYDDRPAACRAFPTRPHRGCPAWPSDDPKDPYV